MASPLLHALPIAAVGVAAAQVLMTPALRAAGSNAGATVRGMAMIVRAVPVSNLLFAFVLSFLALGVPDVDLAFPLIVVGTAAALAAILQAFVVRARFPAVAADPSKFDRVLPLVVLPEVITVGAFIWGFLQFGQAQA